MKSCKRYEKLYTDYALDLLGDDPVASMEAHLRACPACAREVSLLQGTVRLTDEIGDMPIPDVILDNLDMKVYKRLATGTSHTPEAHIGSRMWRVFPTKRPNWIWRGAIATCVLAVGIPLATTFVDWDGTPELSVEALPAPTSHERVEQFRQLEIQMSRDEALYSKHLKYDDHSAKLQLLLAKHTPGR